MITNKMKERVTSKNVNDMENNFRDRIPRRPVIFQGPSNFCCFNVWKSSTVYSNFSFRITKGIYFKNFTSQYFFCMLINNETLKHFQESNALKFKEAKY